MKVITRIVLPLITLFLLAACQQAPAPPQEEASIDLAGTSWVLSSLNGKLPQAETAVTLQFGTDGSVYGTDGCNQYNTTYTQDGANLTINQPAASTMMACEEAVMNQAAAYMTALTDTTNFTAAGNQLSLTNGEQVLATFVAGTGDAAEVEPEPDTDLAGTNWILTTLNGAPALTETAVTLQFGTDGTVSGTDGCNRFSTSYAQDGTNLTIEQSTGISTLMACEEPVMNQAAAFMTALASATSFTAADNQLSLSNGEEVLATFEADTGDTATGETPEAGGDLAGTNWVLGTLNDELRISGTSPFLQFATDGTVSGSDGCNQFSTTYVQDGSNLTIEQPAASTMMACEEPVMAQATAFMTALADTTNFAMTEYDLALLNGEQILATFIVNSSDLADTAWEVVNYNNGRDAVVSLVLGTEISANFGVEGDLTGNAGCNQYFTTFTASDGSIEIGTIGSSMRFCSEPPGVMEQEAEYLAALESAVTYSLQGDMLQMRTAEDQLAVVMTRKLMVDLPEPEPAVPTGRITGAPQGVNVRSGPGVNFPIIGLAQNGDEGEIVGRSADNRWWAAAVPSAPDGIGWVSADFVIAINASDVPVIEVAPPIIIVPTAAPTPTPIPAPTATPTPQISFTADQTSIQQGQCTTLRWSVENIQAVWVYPQGERFDRFPRTGQGSEQVCPTSTTTYEMRVLLRDGSTVIRQVTVNVTGAAPDPLAGTRWDVVNFNNGQGGLVTLLQNTHMTMVFSTDGQLTGSASCNNYFASYQVNGSNITISPPGSSQRICDVPEGIMEQEAQFLAILPSVATFQINGSILEMRTAGGQGAVVANRIP